MLIGVISDTHNHLDCINKAIVEFNLRNVNLVLHCGDISLPKYAAEFSKLKCGFKAVFGNNDIYQADLENTILRFGIIKREPFSFKIQNKTFLLSHHLNASSNDNAVYDYILSGHTHQPKIIKTKASVFLNPGEACGWRYGKKTAAIIDLDANREEIFEL